MNISNKIIFIIIFVSEVFSNEITIFKQNSLYGYKENNKIIIAPIYDEARLFNGNYAIVKQDGLYGVINKLGKFEIKPENANIYFATNDILIISKKYINELSLYSLKKHKQIANNIERVTYINNKYKILLYQKKDSSYKFLFVPKYKVCNYVNNFNFINKSQISYKIEYSDYYEEGTMDLTTCKIEVKKKKIATRSQKNNKNFSISIKGTKCILRNEKNKIILYKQCNEMYFDNTYPLVYVSILKKDKKTKELKLEKYEIYNLNGKKIFNKPLDFIAGSDSGRSLGNGTLAVQELNGKYGLIDINGNILINFAYDNIFALRDNNIYIAQNYLHNRKEYIFNNKGKLILEADNIYSIQNGLIKYERNEIVGLVDLKGKQVINEKYKDIIINDKKYIVKNSDGYWGVVDKKENKLIDFKYDYIGYFHNNIAVFRKGTNIGYITGKGEEIFKIKAQYLSHYSDKMMIFIDDKLCNLEKSSGVFNVVCK